MYKNFLLTTVFCLLPAVSFSQEMKLEVEEKSYRVKDNIFVTVTGQTESLRLKVFNPELSTVEVYQLKEEGKFFFQVDLEGKFLIEASDSSSDVFETVEVLGRSVPEEVCPKSEIGKEIYSQLKQVMYIGSASDASQIADIFAKNKGKEPAQTLINDTFKEIQEFLKDNPKKGEWKEFFKFLEAYYTSLNIPSEDMDKYRSLWEDTEEAFRCRGENP